MITNLIKINRFKSEESFFKFLRKKPIYNKITKKIFHSFDAKKLFLE